LLTGDAFCVTKQVACRNRVGNSSKPKDGKDIAEVLRSKDYCGYVPRNVKLLLDDKAIANGIRQGLTNLAKAAGAECTAVVFFSGHGGRVETGPEAGTYLIPYDCDPHQIQKTAIESEELTTLLSKIKAQRLVVLLDACHSAGMGELKTVAPLSNIKAGLDEKTYSALAEGTGRVIMASSRSTEVSLILEGMSNSLFTHYLLEALKGARVSDKDGLIRVFDIFQYISDTVPSKCPSQKYASH
jgi:metacaspase-1